MDVHFVKGHSHNICEDYGIINPFEKFMIIADGCSTGYRSDVAARILVHAAKSVLIHHSKMKTVPTYSSLRYGMLSNALVASNALGLGDLLSTVLVAFKHPFENRIIVYVYGDGYVVWKTKSNRSLMARKIDYNRNAPNYPWYLLNPEKYSINDANALESRIENGIVDERIEIDRNYKFKYIFECDEIEYVGLLTDGIASFIANKSNPKSQFGNNITDTDAISNLFRFTGTVGEFVKRRMNRFVKQIQGDGFIFDDDLTCAVMMMESGDESLS